MNLLELIFACVCSFRKCFLIGSLYQRVSPASIGREMLPSLSEKHPVAVHNTRRVSIGPVTTQDRSSVIGDRSSVVRLRTKKASIGHVSTQARASIQNKQPFLEKTIEKKRADSFPIKLYRMLSSSMAEGSSEDEEEESIVAWKSHGRSFFIYDEEKFVEALLPKYFKQTKMTSFYRQLSRYGFSRLKTGLDAGAFFHILFLRGMPFLCDGIVRIKLEGRSNFLKSLFSANCELDFYSMPPVEEIAASFASWDCNKDNSNDDKRRDVMDSNLKTSVLKRDKISRSVFPSELPSNHVSLHKSKQENVSSDSHIISIHPITACDVVHTSGSNILDMNEVANKNKSIIIPLKAINSCRNMHFI
mmetsp:Transcript_46795/g.69230  ORF Transcript_46795/g.69230 Transcript_46795/m.69230 type:complete len:360 (+) Transcript_46795:2-1081(+)